VWIRPTFDSRRWNCWQATLDGHPRTNNYNEGKNRADKRRHLRNKPTLSQCVLLDRLDEFRTRNRYLM
jgi:hypothetical protein